MNEENKLAASELSILEKTLKKLRKECDAISRQYKLKHLKQAQIIKLLEKEKNEIKSELEVNKTKLVKTSDEKLTRDIVDLIEKDTELTKTYNTKTQHLKEMQIQLRNLKEQYDVALKNEKIEEMKTLGNLEKSYIALENVKKQIHVKNEKLGKVITENKILRQEIDVRLQERKLFVQFFEDISRKLNTGKKIVFDVVDNTTHVYDQRHDIGLKLTTLKAKVNHDFLRTSSDMQEIQRETLQVIELNRFMANKHKIREGGGVVPKEALRKLEISQNQQDEIQKNKSIINEITNKFKKANLNNLVLQCLKMEEDNYNIYNFNNTQYMRMEKFRWEVDILELDISDQQCFNDKQQEIIKMESANLDEQLCQSKLKVQNTEQALEYFKPFFKSILKDIEHIFQATYCEIEGLESKLGQNRTVNEHNVMQFLNIIEVRLHDIASLARYQLEIIIKKERSGAKKHSKEDENFRTISAVHRSRKKDIKQNTITRTPCPLCAEKLEISEIDETIAVPLDSEEIRKQVEEDLKGSDWANILHDISECMLPESRQIMQRQGLLNLE